MWSKWSSKIKSKKILEVSWDLNMYFIYTVYSYRMKKILPLHSCCIFSPKNLKLYIADPVIADTFSKNRTCPLYTGSTVYIFSFTQLNKRRNFLLRRLVSLLFLSMLEKMCLWIMLAFWIQLFQSRFIFDISFQFQKV